MNTYARPARPWLPFAPTTAVVPEMATAVPKSSPATVSEPFNSPVCFQPREVLVNTYARPAKLP